MPNVTPSTIIWHDGTDLFRPQAGRILLDGVPRAETARAEFRRAIALVPQDPVRRADGILIFDRGRIVAEDSHDALVAHGLPAAPLRFLPMTTDRN